MAGLTMQDLYDHLMENTLPDTSPFYFIDQELDDVHYRIFSYRASIPRDFKCNMDLESRGIMFEMLDDKPIRLACRPPEKFFNHTEHSEYDFDIYDRPDDIDQVFDKADGSLISTYLHKGELKLKSKGSVKSDHANAAMWWLAHPAQGDIESALRDLAGRYTVNMEWVSPETPFRIVLNYSKPQLIVLNARHIETGEYLPHDTMELLFGKYLIEQYHGINNDIKPLIENMSEKEGYVITNKDGLRVKVKCQWYLDRHRCIDIIKNPNNFIELVLKGEADDVKQLMFHLKDEMDRIEYAVTRYVNHTANTVTTYFEEHKDWIRKDYAIKAKEVLSSVEFTFAMMYYVKREEPDWNGFLIRSVKKIDWGL
ncbi:MAG: T4 RnlA family RNA ligase [Candidatus Peribacteraceae bacterium]|nr:T4 RnlA family RNA ligase [Candidatus Peribacteraceae bacterium]